MVVGRKELSRCMDVYHVSLPLIFVCITLVGLLLKGNNKYSLL